MVPYSAGLDNLGEARWPNLASLFHLFHLVGIFFFFLEKAQQYAESLMHN